MNDNKVLISFLKDLTNSLESGSLSDKKEKEIEQFYRSFKKEEVTEEIVEFSQEQLVKFLFLGWFIYSYILNEDQNKL